MSKRLEIEKKYYCNDINKMMKILDRNNLKKIENTHEVDEYFTDIESEYIKNRTCLRIRKTNFKDMEITFKGKSLNFSNFYAKSENNIKIDISNYKNLVDFLASLGFYSYVEVNKNRNTYTKVIENITYNVMIDTINEVGTFIEFELLADEEFGIEVITKKLEEFVEEFKELDLEEALLPYRDYCAIDIYNKYLKDKKIILLDFDGTIVNSEKIFFKSFQEVIFNMYGYNISIEDYIVNEQEENENLIRKLKNEKIIPNDDIEEDIMKEVYKIYENNILKIVQDKYTILNIKLLEKLKENKKICLGIVSTSKKQYINKILEEFNCKNIFSTIIAREDVEQLKPEADGFEQAIDNMKKNGIKFEKNEILVIEDSKRRNKISC